MGSSMLGMMLTSSFAGEPSGEWFHVDHPAVGEGDAIDSVSRLRLRPSSSGPVLLISIVRVAYQRRVRRLRRSYRRRRSG